MGTTPNLVRPLIQANTVDGGTVQQDGQIIGLNDGGYVIVYNDQSPIFTADQTVVGQRFDAAGNKVGGELRVSQFDDGQDAVFNGSSITNLHNGNIAFAYTDLFQGDNDVWVRVLNPALGVVRDDAIDTGTAQTKNASIASFADGSYAVSYTLDNGGGNTPIIVRIVSATGVVGAPITVRDNGMAAADFSQLATLSNNTFVDVYQQHVGLTQDIYLAIYTSAGVPIIQHSVFGADGIVVVDETDPDVAALAGGDFVVGWTDSAGDADIGGQGPRMSIYDNAGNLVAGDIQIHTTTQLAQNEVSLVALKDGGFVATWEDDAYALVRGQRFDAMGHQIGGEFVVKNYSSAQPNDTQDSALLSDGRFAFALGDMNAGDSDVYTSIWDTRNQPPVITSNGGGAAVSIALPENATAVTTVTASDVDGPSLAFSIAGGSDAAKFQINATTGALSFIDAPNFEAPVDADANNSYIVQVRASDGILFDDQTITVNVTDIAPELSTKNDFNGDGLNDILWQNANGAPAVWLLNGTNILSFGPPIVNPGAAWHENAAADFNGDGKADILFQNDNGTPAVWLMNGTSVLSFGPQLANPGPSWHEKAAADFNGDGNADILWQNDNGATAVWLMDASVASYGPALPNPGPTWHANEAADFNGDGKADILWQRDDGTPAVWLMDGANLVSFGAPIVNPGAAWHEKAAADFNGDGKADILFQNDNGAAAVWLMDGTTILSMGPALPNPGPAWHAKEAYDANGDGRADIFWQNDDGTPAVWLMDGTQFVSFGAPQPNPGADWHIV